VKLNTSDCVVTVYRILTKLKMNAILEQAVQGIDKLSKNLKRYCDHCTIKTYPVDYSNY